MDGQFLPRLKSRVSLPHLMKSTIDYTNAMVAVYPGIETNPFAGPEKACNGGGYSQPSGGATFFINGQHITVEINDSSCGDFGSRVYYCVKSKDHVWNWCEGTMENASIDDPETVSDILDSIAGCLNINPCALLDAAWTVL